jgi:tRNA(Ile)-lysidine synthetase-like protein
MAGLSRDIAAVHLRAADALIRGGRDGKVIDFPNGYRLSLRDGNLSFFKSDGESPGRGVSRAAPPERTLRLDAFLSDTESPGRTERVFSVDAGPHVVEFSLRPASGRGETASRSEPGRAASHILLSLDFDLLMAGHGEISVRGRRAGDWIRPAGMDGRKLIQDLFVDAKLPRENRDAVPLITAGSEALCVLAAGRLRRTTGNYAVTPATARTLLVRLRDGADSK